MAAPFRDGTDPTRCGQFFDLGRGKLCQPCAKVDKVYPVPYPRTMTSRVLAVSRWLVPSLVGAAAAAIVAGLVEGRAQAPIGLASSVGYAWIAAGPYALLIALLVRAIARAWRPGELALVDADGSHAVLAGWLGALWVATAFVMWAMMQGTWRIAAWTAFKPLTAGFLAGGFAVVAVIVAGSFTPPLARGVTWIVRGLDGRWQRRGHRTLARPGLIIGVLVVLTVATLAFVWFTFAQKRLKTVSLEGLGGPMAGLAALPLAHAAWQSVRVRVRDAVGIAVVLGVAICVVLAVRTTSQRPALALAMWGTQPLARSAITRLADVERIRATLPRETFRPVAQPSASHPDILLVTLGGVRADATPPYGGGAEMPVLRELGRKAALFQQTFATSPSPTRALRSLLLGIDDRRVRARPTLDPRHVLVSDRLRAGGYETAAFICCKDLAPGLARGLDRIVIDRDGARLAEAARDWVTARDQAGTTTPLFVWVHLDLPPSAGTPSGPVDRRAEYNARLVGVDASLRQIIAGWQARPPTRAPIIVVAGTSGMGLGDHDQVGDSYDLFNSHVRVPLLVSGPALRVQTIAEPVSAVDIVPTLLALAGFIPPPSLEGRSLAEVVRGTAASKPTEGAAHARMERSRMAVRGQWKLILQPGEPLLFDLRSDPFERTNQAPRKLVLVEQLTKLVEDHETAMKASPF